MKTFKALLATLFGIEAATEQRQSEREAAASFYHPPSSKPSYPYNSYTMHLREQRRKRRSKRKKN